MKINILTPDTLKPNLAAMKISAFHKINGDEVYLNFPLINADFTYASILFSWTPDPYADLIGGPKYPESKLDPAIDTMKPDYLLYSGLDHSIGYTYKACPRTCNFCVVPKQHNDEKHYSIWTFHNPRFKKIGLLNNNTFADFQWRETFHEIWDAKLTLIDLSGFDLRLITEESAEYISKTRIQGQIHVAWDFIEHEDEVIRGLNYLLDAGIRAGKITCYLLMGYETTEEEDLYRLCRLREKGILAYAMPYEGNKLKFPPKFIWAINRPMLNKKLDFSGKTYESVTKQFWVKHGRILKTEMSRR
jgi:hypothetical protein